MSRRLNGSSFHLCNAVDRQILTAAIGPTGLTGTRRHRSIVNWLSSNNAAIDSANTLIARDAAII